MLDISSFITAKNFTEAICYRYFVSDIPEERLLYLDSDIIVDGSLYDMYFLDFNDNYAYAVKDMFINDIACQSTVIPYFNSGVILINNTLWKELNMKEKLIQSTLIYNKTALLDQDNSNYILKDKWLALDTSYNYQMGIVHNIYSSEIPIDSKFSQMSAKDLWHYFQEDIVEVKPKIIHYTTEFKPWINNGVSVLMKEKYWFYYQLSWNQIRQQHNL